MIRSRPPSPLSAGLNRQPPGQRPVQVASVRVVSAAAVVATRARGVRIEYGHAVAALAAPGIDALLDRHSGHCQIVGIPLAAWPALVGELARVTRPGGWVQLVEPLVGVTDAGPAVERFNQLALQIAAARGLDTTGSSSTRSTATCARPG